MKSKIKHPSDMPRRDSNTIGSDLWSNMLRFGQNNEIINLIMLWLNFIFCIEIFYCINK